MTIEEAKQMLTQENVDKLKEIVTTRVNVNMNNKINNDILMQALCKAVSDDVIHSTSLDDMMIKLLNSSTNTISSNKLCQILKTVRTQQKNISCVIELKKGDLSETINTWVFTGENGVKFNGMLEFIIEKFDITPISTRNLLSNTLKSTIVNNMSQFVSKFIMASPEEREEIGVSINTVTRLVNMTGNILTAEFKSM